MELKTGIKGRAEVTVDETNVASAIGSGAFLVYSTPSMILLMEKASHQLVKPYIEEGSDTVGIDLNVAHLAATPIGQKVWAESELIDINGRVLTFKVEAFSEVEKIGEGTHKRCIINNQKFLEKLESRYSK